MKRLPTFIIIFVIILLSISPAYSESTEPSGASAPAGAPTDITAESSILIDSASGNVLYEQNADRRQFPASTTKMMVAILAIEMGDPEKSMTASQAAVDDIGKDGSNIGIIAGEHIQLKYLLQALLVCSANETANIIAENLCPTRQGFIDLMNKKAQELGATNTHFVNTNGAHDPDHYTTASDLAKIARYAMTLPKFREIVQEDHFNMPPTDKHDSWPVLRSTNKLLNSDENGKYVVNGVKTGFTTPAGYNLVSSGVSPDGMELISVVMGVRGDGAQQNVRTFSKELLDYGFDNYSLVSFQKSGSVYRSVDVENAGDTQPLNLITKGDVSAVLPIDHSQWDLKEIPHINANITAPVNEGDMMGYVDYQIKGKSIGKVDLLASRSVTPKPKPQAVIQKKVSNVMDNTVVRIALAVFLLTLFFLILRKVLRTVSRKVNTRRYNRY